MTCLSHQQESVTGISEVRWKDKAANVIEEEAEDSANDVAEDKKEKGTDVAEDSENTKEPKQTDRPVDSEEADSTKEPIETDRNMEMPRRRLSSLQVHPESTSPKATHQHLQMRVAAVAMMMAAVTPILLLKLCPSMETIKMYLLKI